MRLARAGSSAHPEVLDGEDQPLTDAERISHRKVRIGIADRADRADRAAGLLTSAVVSDRLPVSRLSPRRK